MESTVARRAGRIEHRVAASMDFGRWRIRHVGFMRGYDEEQRDQASWGAWNGVSSASGSPPWLRIAQAGLGRTRPVDMDAIDLIHLNLQR